MEGVEKSQRALYDGDSLASQLAILSRVNDFSDRVVFLETRLFSVQRSAESSAVNSPAGLRENKAQLRYFYCVLTI